MKVAQALALLLLVVFIAVEGRPQVGESASCVSIKSRSPTIGKRTYTLSVSPSSGPVGSMINATYNSDTVANTFIGVFASGSSTTNLFNYIPASAGFLTFPTTGLSPGNYNVNLVANYYIKASVPYTVTGGTTSSSTTTGSTTTTTTSTTTTTGGGGDETAWLNAHNKRRAVYGMPALKWSVKLAASAQSWANTLADRCTLAPSRKYGVGENLAAGQDSIDSVLVSWADDQAKNYDPKTQSCKPGTQCGSFTQVMWRPTDLLGCGKAYCGSTPYYVCQYIRPGNCNGYNYEVQESPCPYFDDTHLWV